MKIIYHENKTFYYSEEFDSYNVVFNKWKYFLIYIKREILINKGKIIKPEISSVILCHNYPNYILRALS